VVLSKYFQEYYHRKLETKNRVGQTAQEERDSLRSGDQADQSDLCIVEGQRGFEDLASTAVVRA